MNDRSCLYYGHVMHHRLRPRAHRLRYRVYWLFLDLDEIEALSRRLWLFSYNKPNILSFFDRDHGDGSKTSIKLQIIRHLEAAGISGDGIKVQVLCMPRVMGYDFNPLTVYYCTHGDGELVAMIYEVNNTYGERHSYVVPAGNGDGDVRQRCEKGFYVSPFLGMKMSYRFRAKKPGGHIALGVGGYDDAGLIINTGLSGRRRALTDLGLARLLLTYPLLTLKVVASIYWHALVMWWQGFEIMAKPAPPENDITIIEKSK